ncbi:MAG: hypothetical protein M1819_006062 [Sarea resinae]|nr:MAG: hypothetical protein M1819_006062 [Sarea resinae]
MATSPPSYSTHAPTSLPTNPKKRPSLSTAPSGTTKRRKASAATSIGSAHPLRQTSFPPEESLRSGAGALTRSPSVESSVAGSIGGVREADAERGKGKKRRRSGGRSTADTRSVKSGRTGAASVKSAGGASGGKGETGTTGGAGGEDDGEDDEEDGGGVDAVLEGGGEKVDEAYEKYKLSVLMEAMNDDQVDRYTLFRRARLRKETVRKIANQTLSQSVPPSVITTINGYTKVFIGELIEKAREVQTQCLLAEAQAKDDDRTPPTTQSSAKDPTENNPLHPLNRGPLLPDHLREALRRYKKEGEGGGAGFRGLSLGGVEETASRNRGRRLFK